MQTQTLSQPITKSRGNIRWLMVIFFMSGIILNYIDRGSLGILAQVIKDELSITTEQYAYVVGAFQLAYTIFQPIVGWFVDVIGLRIGFAIMVVTWSLMCMLHAGASTWIHLAIVRFVMGGAEAVAAPANAKIITEWFPKKERSVANGWSMVGFSLGGAMAPPLIYFIYRYWGWQAAFFIPGLLGLIWSFFWFRFYAPPAQHKSLSESEKAYILEDQDAIKPAKKKLWPSIQKVIVQKKFYGIALPAFLAEPAWSAVMFWVPLYLLEERGMDLKSTAMFVWIPFLTADFGGIAGGYFSRYLNVSHNFTRINAAVCTYAGAAFLMLSMALATLTSSPYTAIALISIGAFAHQIISSMLTVQVMENFNADEVATVNGLRGSCAWTASFIFTMVLGYFVSTMGFKPFFIAMGFFDLLGAIIMFFILYQGGKKAKEALIS